MTSDPTLVLIHAFPLDASMWSPQLEAFPGVLAPDLPGFGAASGLMTSIAAATEAVIATMDEEDVSDAVICGLSTGGYVALDIWRSHPDRVRGLVLSNTRAEADDDAGRQKRKDLANRLRTEGSEFLVASPPPLISSEAPPSLVEEVRGIIAEQEATAIAAASEAMGDRPDSTADLAGITVPTLVITSTGDELIPAAITTLIADGIPGSMLETIPGAGHLSNMEEPARFNELLGAHLERC
ncbi:MAG: alpha/beta hydrolase [Actinobacteria bacterium]|nr:alpha/beta hydrolase [Actinomycetota bacterium]